MKATRLRVDQTWDGEPVGDDERASLELRLGEAELSVETDAPFHADPAPPAPPGSCDGLWEFEAVELFLLGDGQRYLEIELGPLGHYLVLQLRRARCVEAHGLPLEYASERVGGRWRGRARVPLGYLPPGLRACNAYAIHGLGPHRRCLAAHPVRAANPTSTAWTASGPWAGRSVPPRPPHPPLRFPFALCAGLGTIGPQGVGRGGFGCAD